MSNQRMFGLLEVYRRHQGEILYLAIGQRELVTIFDGQVVELIIEDELSRRQFEPVEIHCHRLAHNWAISDIELKMIVDKAMKGKQNIPLRPKCTLRGKGAPIRQRGVEATASARFGRAHISEPTPY